MAANEPGSHAGELRFIHGLDVLLRQAIEQLTRCFTLKRDRRIIRAGRRSEKLLQSRPTVTAWLVDAGDGPDARAWLGPSDLSPFGFRPSDLRAPDNFEAHPSTEIWLSRAGFESAPGRIRTCGLRFRRRRF